MSEETTDSSPLSSIQSGTHIEIPLMGDLAQEDENQLLISEMFRDETLNFTDTADSSFFEDATDGSHFNSMKQRTSFELSSSSSSPCKSIQPSTSQQKIAFIQPYTEPSLIGHTKNIQYFTSQQEESLYIHLRELIKVYKSGYLDRHTIIDLINKKVTEEGWKSLEGQISTKVLDKFLDRHEDIKCYIDTDIRIALLQENILYSHVINYMGNLKSNLSGSLRQIDKDTLYNIVKEQVNEYGWENLYSISDKWVDSFLERHSDLKKFVNSKMVEKDHCSVEDDNHIRKTKRDPVKVVHATSTPPSNISEKSNKKTPKTKSEESDSRSWGIISDVFSLNPSSIDETAEFSEKDLELLSLSSSFKNVTPESSTITTSITKKELEYKLSQIQSKFKSMRRKSKPSLLTTSRIADAVTSQKADASASGPKLNNQHQNSSDATEIEASDILLPSIENMEKSGPQLKKGGKTRMTAGMTNLLAFTFQHEHFPSSTNMACLAKVMGIHWSRVRNWFTKQRLECKKSQFFLPKDKILSYCPYCEITLKEPKEQKEHLFQPPHIQKALEGKVQAKFQQMNDRTAEGLPSHA